MRDGPQHFAQSPIPYSRQLIKAKRFDEAESYLRNAAKIAQQNANPKFRFAIGAQLEQLLAYDQAWTEMASLEPPDGLTLPDWEGSPLSQKNLVVHKRVRDIGADLRMGRLIELAGRNCRACQAVVDRRLVALFARSFPSCRFTPAGEAISFEGIDWLASYELLGKYLATTADSIREQFVPLAPNLQRVKELRASYRAEEGRTKLVGISWHSSNDRKDVPTLVDWASFVERLAASAVSVNSGDRSSDISTIRKTSGVQIAPDIIDQEASLDDLAAQISAIDTMVTISNTTAHMAGSLGHPVHLILTEFASMTWPVRGHSSPWYPNLKIHRKLDGNWSNTLAKIAHEINSEFAPAT